MKATWLAILLWSHALFSGALSSEGYSHVSTLNEIKAQEEIARKESRPMLLAFLGAGWCPWSEKAEKEIFSKDKLLDVLKGVCHLVIVEVPKVKTAAWEEITSCFTLDELPTYIFLSESGECIAREGFLPMRPEEFVFRTRAIFQQYRDMKEKITALDSLSENELRKLYARAKSLHLTSLQDQILARGVASAQTPYFLLEKYEHIAPGKKTDDLELSALKKAIQKLDPFNQKRSHLRLAFIDFSLREQRKKGRKNAKYVIAPLEEYCKKYGKTDVEDVWKVEMAIAQYLASRNEHKESAKHAKLALEKAPDGVREEVSCLIQNLASSTPSR